MAASKSKLPKEALEFAKKMGADLTGLEVEAEDMWHTLNEMSERSEYEYSEFIKEQFDSAKATEAAEKNGEAGQKGQGQFFRPTSGISFEAITIGGDGVKVRVVHAGVATGKKLFINLCHHPALELPKDYNGKVVSEDRYTAGGLEIPLAVGPLRDLPDNAGMAVDVVMHPSVIARCQAHNMFLDQVVTLAMDTVSAESGVKLQKKWKSCKNVYVGGRGDDKSTPVLFPVDPPKSSPTSNGGGSKSDISSPSDLLGAMISDRERQANSLLDSSVLTGSGSGSAAVKAEASQNRSVFDMLVRPPVNAPMASTGEVSQKKETVRAEPKIVDMSAPKPDQSQTPSSNANVREKGPSAIKKGFFSDSKASLYPGGSNEGKGSNKGGTYTRLMSKCTVVDTASGAVQHSVSTPSSVPVAAAPEALNGESMISSFPSSSEVHPEKEKEIQKVITPLPGRREVSEMENLVKLVDSAWDPGDADGDSGDLSTQQVNAMLGDMAKVWNDSGSISLPSVPARVSAAPLIDPPHVKMESKQQQSSSALSVTSSFPADVTIIANLIHKDDGESHILGVKIYGLGGKIASIADKNVDLQISATHLVFSIGAVQTVRVSGLGALQLDPVTTKAAFSKKRGVLSVDVQTVR